MEIGLASSLTSANMVHMNPSNYEADHLVYFFFFFWGL